MLKLGLFVVLPFLALVVHERLVVGNYPTVPDNNAAGSTLLTDTQHVDIESKSLEHSNQPHRNENLKRLQKIISAVNGCASWIPPINQFSLVYDTSLVNNQGILRAVFQCAGTYPPKTFAATLNIGKKIEVVHVTKVGPLSDTLVLSETLPIKLAQKVAYDYGIGWISRTVFEEYAPLVIAAIEPQIVSLRQLASDTELEISTQPDADNKRNSTKDNISASTSTTSQITILRNGILPNTKFDVKNTINLCVVCKDFKTEKQYSTLLKLVFAKDKFDATPTVTLECPPDEWNDEIGGENFAFKRIAAKYRTTKFVSEKEKPVCRSH